MLARIRLDLVDYFDSLVADVDLKAERLIIADQLTPNGESRLDEINSKRNAFIKQIRAILAFNLAQADAKYSTQPGFKPFTRFCFIIDDNQLDLSSCLGPVGSTFGYLIVLDRFVDQPSLDCYKELLGFYFNEKRMVSPKGKLSTVEKLFRLRNKTIDDQNQQFIVQRNGDELFKGNFVVNTTYDELFKIDVVVTRNVLIESIAMEAAYLFRHVSLIELNNYDPSDEDYNPHYILDTIRTLESYISRGEHSIILRINQCKSESITSDIKLFNDVSNMTEMYLNNNRITSISSSSFNRLHKLKCLHLWSNFIGHIEPSCFESLSALQELDLSFNFLINLDADAFRGANNLSHLYLFNNQISEINSKTFNSLTKLTELNLNNNQIKSIEAGSFDNLINLRSLSLEGNEIQFLDPYLFKDLINLDVINLSTNRLSFIDPATFKSLRNLQTLNLDSNEIKHMDASTLDTLSNLRILYLNNNKMSWFESGTFAGLTSLRELWLFRNKIERLDASSFHGLDNLEYVNLEYNQIQQIQLETLFQGLNKLKTVYLYNNRLNPDELLSSVNLVNTRYQIYI